MRKRINEKEIARLEELTNSELTTESRIEVIELLRLTVGYAYESQYHELDDAKLTELVRLLFGFSKK